MSLQMKYFVLKPKGDSIYSTASRAAMRAYANAIRNTDGELCDQLREWADEEHRNAFNKETTPNE